MSEQNTASPATRLLLRSVATGVANPDSMANLNTAVLPDGAMCFVKATAALYYLDKTAVSGGISPVAGPGQWLLFDVAEAKSGVAMVSANAYNSFPVDGAWHLSTQSSFVNASVTDSDWALTALGGVLTYSGDPRKFLVTLSASVEVGNVSAARDVFLGVTKNGAAIGTVPTGGTSGEVDGTIASAGQVLPMTTSSIVSLTATDTIAPMMAGPAAATSLSAMTRMTVTPA